MHFAAIAEALARLLKEFGPSRKSYHPEFPFWHLQTDGFWEVEKKGALPLKPGGRSPTKQTLLTHDAVGAVPSRPLGGTPKQPCIAAGPDAAAVSVLLALDSPRGDSASDSVSLTTLPQRSKRFSAPPARRASARMSCGRTNDDAPSVGMMAAWPTCPLAWRRPTFNGTPGMALTRSIMVWHCAPFIMWRSIVGAVGIQ